MNSRPIIFDAKSVRAILAGEKTQTRRVVKPQPEFAGVRSYERGKWARVISAGGRDEHDFFVPNPVASMGDMLPNTKNGPWISPYGDDPNDLLWVRETFCSRFVDPPGPNGYYDGWWYLATDDPGTMKVDGDGGVVYRKNGEQASPWISPMRMPREASRITLRVTGVRIERLQEISGGDARAEGVKYPVKETSIPGKVAPLYQLPEGLMRAAQWGIVKTAKRKAKRLPTHDDLSRLEYSLRWDRINGKRGFGWDSNPWVWVVTFERVEAST